MKNEKEIKKLEKAVEDINKRIDKLKEDKPKFEVGKWYKHGKLSIFCFVKENGLGVNGYGFNPDGWCDDNTWSKNWEITSATNEEVEAALIAEAKKRGFKEGVIVDLSSINPDWQTRTKINGSSRYLSAYDNDDNDDYNNALVFGACYIFSKGQWAEIIEEPKAVINGYEMEQEGDLIKFGCDKFNKEFFKALNSDLDYLNGGCDAGGVLHRGIQIDNNRKIKLITLDSGVEITVKQLQEIVDNIK